MNIIEWQVTFNRMGVYGVSAFMSMNKSANLVEKYKYWVTTRYARDTEKIFIVFKTRRLLFLKQSDAIVTGG